MQNSQAEEAEVSLAIHLAFEQFEARNLAFHLSVALRPGQARSHGLIIASQSCGDAFEFARSLRFDPRQPPIEGIGLLLPDHRHELLCQLIGQRELVARLRDLLQVVPLRLSEYVGLFDQQKGRLTRREATCAGRKSFALGAGGPTSRLGRASTPLGDQGAYQRVGPPITTSFDFLLELRRVLASSLPALTQV